MSRVDNNMPAFATTRPFRRFVLGTAFFLGLAVALAPRSPEVYAQEPKTGDPPPASQKAPEPPKAGKSLTIKDGRGAEIKIDVGQGGKTSVTESAAGDADADTPRRKDGKKRAQITIDGLEDKEFDSFDEFVHDQPALAAMVVAIVATVFFAPVLAIALILWYRMRKARMLNETMLKLAEKGIVPPAEAIDALGGKAGAAATVAPYYEQAKLVRRRAAWSDLRKGVLMAGFGFALSLHSLITSRGPNVVGLVLLFVGLGFVVLWWFEERNLPTPGNATSGAGPGALPPGNAPPT
jgi:hypothetical protein